MSQDQHITLWFVHNSDAYELILNNTLTHPKSIIRYPHCLNTRGELIDFDDLDEDLQEKIITKLVHFEKDLQE